MKNSKWLSTFILILGLAVMAAGCAKPPEAEKAAAKEAMDAALAAHADKYATADYDAARKLWEASEAQVKEKKYKEAKQGYMDAKAAFEKATGGVEAGKKAFTEQATAAVGTLEAGWRDLQTLAMKVEKKIEKKGLWESDQKTFLEGLQAAKGMIATDPAGAIMKAGQLKQFLDSYGTIFKQMAAGTVKPQTATKKSRQRD